jgi:hypothetical protein
MDEMLPFDCNKLWGIPSLVGGFHDSNLPTLRLVKSPIPPEQSVSQSVFLLRSIPKLCADSRNGQRSQGISYRRKCNTKEYKMLSWATSWNTSWSRRHLLWFSQRHSSVYVRILSFWFQQVAAKYTEGCLNYFQLHIFCVLEPNLVKSSYGYDDDHLLGYITKLEKTKT